MSPIYNYQSPECVSNPNSAPTSALHHDGMSLSWMNSLYCSPSSALMDARPCDQMMFDTFAAAYDQSSFQRPWDYRLAVESVPGTLQPQMMMHHPDYAAYEDVSHYNHPDLRAFEQIPSPPSSSAAYERSYRCTEFSPASTTAAPNTPTSRCTEEADEEVDDPTDKPYARLIYEALMQAPGHRMMLREIYEWFTANTNKPQDSGSHGWQNSIRHNLSMNQAFENDKSESSTRGQPRKANSMWLLTEHAIKHGVQSTTRYRKTGTSKKHSGTGMAATTRQKSGSKGGKAARRAAMLRRQEGQSRSQPHFEPSCTTQSPTGYGYDMCASPYSHRPTTPADNMLCTTPYELSQSSTFQPRLLLEEHNPLDDEGRLHEYVIQPGHEDVQKLTRRPTPFGTVFA